VDATPCTPPLTERDKQTAVAELQAGPLRWLAEVRVTPAGVLAVGALLAGTLLSTAVIVWASAAPARIRASRK